MLVQVLPSCYWYGKTEEENEPENLAEIRRLATPRPDLSLSGFSAEDFKKVETAYCTAFKRWELSASAIPFIEGYNPQDAGGGTLFNNLALPTEDTSTQTKPDIYNGARRGRLDQKIRKDLKNLIIPSPKDGLPVPPNFFMEAQGDPGDPNVAKRQACFYGALGARGIQALRSYQPGKSHCETVYDNRVYTITAAYIDGVLSLFAHHLKGPTDQVKRPTCFMVPLKSFLLMESLESFREGATAYRNARD
ncbi:uncharacterized protein KD926_006243 [Aspergillus affinis]|uniref:uncharacterized protein n=1 Tax=Aspergillus affinis TaxID=1070780 RepID=UPI0022FE1987|nr:uncharacterized protein KD926_006243 [Aspergillus affinis]KAI9041906.1 hypothetical protein KD926_006243 [Aspergillus affinis]